ncbi:MAG: type II toxin-antitoxin system RelE/ParE family toxin [Novosphingobium sp.]|nr:type II toxin-antitoxin system RelE/ParE family toxin [Novosphingobium sp.]
MPDLHIGRRAASDLAEIADYTIAEFRIERACKYRDLLQACFKSLLENPHLGRSADELAPGMRRIRQQAHVIFYQSTDNGILIVRVLHQSRECERRL